MINKITISLLAIVCFWPSIQSQTQTHQQSDTLPPNTSIVSNGDNCDREAEVTWGDWQQWGDMGDGTYRNPIIPADYSDIDCIRVGDDYYAITSTFQFSPGMTLLHSVDLVNWEIVTNIINDLTQISPELDWSRMNRYARGVWAGTLRYHDGRFYLFFGTPDEGLFVTTSPNPEGPWSQLTALIREPGWDDCTAMWDDNGKACFVATNFKDGYKTYMFEMSPDGMAINRESALLINSGNGREASKLIKVGDWHYLIFSEYKPGIGRYVVAKRSRSMFGPYDQERQLALTSAEALEPNQGGIVQGIDGNWHFLTHHGTGDWSGRVLSLLPVTWIDEWPIIGQVIPSDNIGKMAWTAPMPAPSNGKRTITIINEDFDSINLAPHWQWNYQPRTEFFSLTQRPGWLRLKAFRPLATDCLMKAGNTLTQRTFRKKENAVTLKMDISQMTDGQKAGLCHFSKSHSAIRVTKDGNQTYIEYRDDDGSIRGDQLTQPHIWLR